MKKLVPVISKEAPAQRDALWLKPVPGGFMAYALDGGVWGSLKTDSEQPSHADDGDVQKLIGSVKDKKGANTINGAKAFAVDAVAGVVGKKSDDSSALTLHGLKAYIDEQLAGLL